MVGAAADERHGLHVRQVRGEEQRPSCRRRRLEEQPEGDERERRDQGVERDVGQVQLNRRPGEDAEPGVEPEAQERDGAVVPGRLVRLEAELARRDPRDPAAAVARSTVAIGSMSSQTRS